MDTTEFSEKHITHKCSEANSDEDMERDNKEIVNMLIDIHTLHCDF